MRGIEHEWHGREDLCCAPGGPVGQALQLTGATLPVPFELKPAVDERRQLNWVVRQDENRSEQPGNPDDCCRSKCTTLVFGNGSSHLAA